MVEQREIQNINSTKRRRNDETSTTINYEKSRYDDNGRSTPHLYVHATRVTKKITMVLSFIIIVYPSLNGLVVFAETPSRTPSFQPSLRPSKRPTNKHSELPSMFPSFNSSMPSLNSSSMPSLIPSSTPSKHPSFIPSTIPSEKPSLLPSNAPSDNPSMLPSKYPSSEPTISTRPSVLPSVSLGPSSQPSTSKMPSKMPSGLPSIQPTQMPSLQPSIVPSKSFQPSLVPSVTTSPSSNPSLSKIPSSTPSISHNPSSMPSKSKNPSSLPTISIAPSSGPSALPSLLPSFFPSMIPTGKPTSSKSPSLQPSMIPSIFPSVKPSISILPSNIPSDQPSTTVQPSLFPTLLPSYSPTDNPSQLPSLLPSFSQNTTSEIEYTQSLILPEGSIRFNISESEKFCAIMTQNKSMSLSVNESYLHITCAITSQQLSSGRKRRHLKGNVDTSSSRILSDVQNTMNLKMTFSSRRIDVEPLPQIYQNFINSQKSNLQKEMVANGLNITQMLTLRILQSPQPTPSPTISPTGVPSFDPSLTPSRFPSSIPSKSPTKVVIFPQNNRSNTDTNTFIIIITAIGTGIVALVVLFVGCYFIRQKRRQQRTESNLPGKTIVSKNSQHSSTPLKKDKAAFDDALEKPEKNYISDASSERLSFGGFDEYFAPQPQTPDNDLLRHDDSLLSNQSLISAGESQSSNSDDEEDDTGNLIDEFDNYKNKNLETMRFYVENAVSDSDAMMSEAVTKALMDDHNTAEESEKAWAGEGLSHMVIESAVLWDMNDWLKKREGASIDEKRAYMQKTLNAMVASVRHGFIDPDLASRIVHGSAAMLGLELAEQIEETTLIVTGMRKTAKTDDMLEAFKEFGEIEDAAVAPCDRGFGMVRYTSTKFAQRAMERFRTGEIVVQDVAVMIRILKSTEPISHKPRQPVANPSTSPIDDLYEQVETERRGNQYSKRARGSGSDSDSTRSRGTSNRSRSRKRDGS